MNAQVSEGGTTPVRRGNMNRLVTDELIPALQDEPGFAGALTLADAGSRDGLMMIMWTMEEPACRPLGEYGPPTSRRSPGSWRSPPAPGGHCRSGR